MKKADEQMAESIRKLSRSASAMAEAIEEGVDVVRHAVKLWPAIFSRLDVRIYDATSAEDNSPIACTRGTNSFNLVEH
jgi:hypothetical protein